ncbi:phage tail tape measure protein [Bosea sp. PAMC 26642]|uniref:phage tail tape measure protein n=1 Tax=Bosea sp. (strain PAMC 26642) TaxID=1792307 RepID=UPI00077030FE|nr:phage tail tape measure protein [Bosea sp. PAMC 26642]AMJ60940.1 hypothetical protein AXW83_12115 [Bosea sp. PAMC 26642]
MVDMRARAVISAEDRTQGVFEKIARRMGLISKAAAQTSYATARMGAQTARRMETQSRSLSRMQSIGGGIGGRIGYGAGGTLAAGAVVMKAATSALSLEKAMFGVRKATDETGDGLKAYETKVLDLARSSGKAKEEVAGILAGAAFAGRPKQELMQFTDYAIAATGAWGTSAAETGQALAELGNIYQANQKRIEEIGDAINTVADSSASKETDLLDFLRRTGGTGKMLGISAENMLALGASLKEIGVQSEVAATGVNALMTKISVPDDGFDDGLKAAGLDAKKFRKAVEKDATGAILTLLKALDKLQGTKKMAVLKDLFGLEYADDIGRLTGSVGRLNELLTIAADKKRVLGSVRGQAAILTEQDFNRLDRANQAIDVLMARIGGGFKIAAGESAAWVNRLVDDFERAGTAADKLLSVVKNIDSALGTIVPKSKGNSVKDAIKGFGDIVGGKNEAPVDADEWREVKSEIGALEKQIADIESRVHPSRRGEFNAETDALMKRKGALQNRILNFAKAIPIPDAPSYLTGLDPYLVDPRRPADARDRMDDRIRQSQVKTVKNAKLPPARPAGIGGTIMAPVQGLDSDSATASLKSATEALDRAINREMKAPFPPSRPADITAKVVDPVKVDVTGTVGMDPSSKALIEVRVKAEGVTVTGMTASDSGNVRASVGASMGHLVNR